MYSKLRDYGTWREQIHYCIGNAGLEISPQEEISDLFRLRAEACGVPVAVIAEDTVRLITDTRKMEPLVQSLLIGSLMHVKPDYLPSWLAERAMDYQSRARK